MVRSSSTRRARVSRIAPLQADPARLKFDLAAHIGPQVLHAAWAEVPRTPRGRWRQSRGRLSAVFLNAQDVLARVARASIAASSGRWGLAPRVLPALPRPRALPGGAARSSAHPAVVMLAA